MPAELLSEVRQQVEESDPPVKAAALLHLARVLTAFDRAEAESMLERGIELAFELPKPAGDKLLTQAVSLAAAVLSSRALRLMPLVPDRVHGRAEGIIFSMLRHGHIADAVSYLSEPPLGEHYPFSAATEAMGRSRNNDDARYLDRIPDRVLRLLAKIELIAAMAGLPQFGGMSIPPRPLRRDRWVM